MSLSSQAQEPAQQAEVDDHQELISAYNLDWEKLKTWLEEKFPEREFRKQVCDRRSYHCLGI
jgi:hypothetical protein